MADMSLASKVWEGRGWYPTLLCIASFIFQLYPLPDTVCFKVYLYPPICTPPVHAHVIYILLLSHLSKHWLATASVMFHSLLIVLIYPTTICNRAL